MWKTVITFAVVGAIGVVICLLLAHNEYGHRVSWVSMWLEDGSNMPIFIILILVTVISRIIYSATHTTYKNKLNDYIKNNDGNNNSTPAIKSLFCNSCGNKTEINSAFCNSCGNKVKQ